MCEDKVARIVTIIDASPSDNLGHGGDSWHTLAVLQAGSWNAVDSFIENLKASLKTQRLQLRKWGGEAESQKRQDNNDKFRAGFINALSASLPNSRVSFFTVSCQERTILSAEKALCKELGLEHSIVMADRDSCCLGGYTRHWRNGIEVVTLGAFEKVSLDGRSQVISVPLTVPHKHAVVWLWMGHSLFSLYKSVVAQHQIEPDWEAHFDRLGGDEVNSNYPGLGFIDLLLKTKTTIKVISSFCEGKPDIPCDIITDCIAGWANERVSKDLLTGQDLEKELSAESKDHLAFYVLKDESDFKEMQSSLRNQN